MRTHLVFGQKVKRKLFEPPQNSLRLLMMDDPAVFIHRICLEKGCACVVGAHVCADAITACSDDTHQAKMCLMRSLVPRTFFFFRKLNQVPDRLRTASVIVFFVPCIENNVYFMLTMPIMYQAHVLVFGPFCRFYEESPQNSLV